MNHCLLLFGISSLMNSAGLLTVELCAISHVFTEQVLFSSQFIYKFFSLIFLGIMVSSVLSLFCILIFLTSYASFCLQGEDLIRESGIPYTIVRPCALTEEPAGADLIFDQGDNITVSSLNRQ